MTKSLQLKSTLSFYLSKTQTRTAHTPAAQQNKCQLTQPKSSQGFYFYQRQNPVESYANICGLGVAKVQYR